MLFVIHLFSLTGKLKGVLIIIQASYSSTLAERVRAPARACVCVYVAAHRSRGCCCEQLEELTIFFY